MKKLPLLITLALTLTIGIAATWTLPPKNPEPFVLLGWDPPDPAVCPPSMIGSYKVYWGVTNSTYTNFITVPGTSTTCGITQFVRGVKYYLAATTVSTNGLESERFSNEVTWTPEPTPPAPGNSRVLGGK